MEFPFVFGQTVVGSQFIDRKKELKKLKANIDQGINTVLISPKGWGKSSLVKQLSLKLGKRDHLKFIFIDLIRQSDEQEFYEAYCKRVLQTASVKPEETGSILKKFLKGIRPDILMGDQASDEYRISFKWDDIERNYDEILDLPERLAKKRKQTFVICIDDFQGMDKFKHAGLFQTRLSSVWQNHANVVYIICGRKRHWMDEVFTNQDNPFYRFGEVMYLPKIKKKYFIRYIMSAFEKSGKIIPKDRVLKIIKLSGNNPYFIQQLARNIWIRSSEMIIDADIIESIDEILMQHSIWYLREVERMTVPQYNYLKAVVNREKNLSGKETITQYKLGTSANVAKIKKVMEDREILDYWNPYPEFTDPFFKLWVKRQMDFK